GADDTTNLRLVRLADGRDLTPAGLKEMRAGNLLRSHRDVIATIPTPESAEKLTCQVWNLATAAAVGPPLRPDADPAEKVDHSAASMAADGSRVAIAQGKTVTVWDLDGGQPVKRRAVLKAGEPVKTLSLSADGSLLTAVTRGRLQSWDVAGGKEA